MWDSAGEEDKREKFRLLNRVREYNETLDVGAINGSKHNDCDRQVADKRGAEQQPSVALMLGRLKHECVEAKLNAKPRKFTSAEQAFKDGQLLEDRFTKGSLRPDIVMHKEPLEGSSDVVAIFDLKFPCPSEGNKSGHWGTRNDGKRQDVAYKEEFPDASIALIYPALKK
ncbi:MAG TPA: hypothetical protein VGV38_12035, partial [Pyrinomonadaceae bacterium]|nr:hypothetical protein [Pyrinomonadaceae bacterium]